MNVSKEFLWVEKYRPKTVAETILPAGLKKQFQAYVDQKAIPTLLLSGRPGMGKTSVATAMLKELDCDYLIINASLNGDINTLRTTITNYATSVSLEGGRKYVILDEADHLTAATQSSLRNFMESYSSNCGFILTCNFKNKIIEPIRDSRCHQIDFIITADEKPKLAAQFFKRVKAILDAEGVQYDIPVVASVIEKQFPDFRRCLNTLQSAAAVGPINETILKSATESSMKELFALLKDKNFDGMRKWVAENQDVDHAVMYRAIYDEAVKYVHPSSMPGVIVTLGDYLHKHAIVVDPEINMAAFLTTIMFESKWL